jgi:hypothetical protein
MDDPVDNENRSGESVDDSNELDGEVNHERNLDDQDQIPDQVRFERPDVNGVAAQGHTAFSLTPAASIGGIIDCSTARGRKLYSAATSKLEDELSNCNAEDLYSFLKALKDRSREYGWNKNGVGILSIPDDPINPTEFKSLTD